ncbi:MAG: CHAT domain-containing protein, partial [Rhodospirillales bacterium]|nr:CHAT domain-containing protein [Rhodospirillales bacterium]
QPAAAMAQFDLAEEGFAPLAPPAQRLPRPAGVPAARGIEAAQASIAEAQLFQDPIAAAAVLGRIAVRRSRAIALLMQGQPDAAAAAAEQARQMADAHGMSQAVMEARLLRTSAMAAEAQGEQGRALSLLNRSALAFGRAFPGSRPLAETELLRAAVLFREKRDAEGLRACRRAVAVLQKLGGAVVATARMMPCLDGFAAAAAAGPAQAAALSAEAFLAAQFAQSTLTSAQIAQSAARLAEAQRDTRVGAAIRRRDEAVARLDRLYRALDAAEDAARRGASPTGPSAAELGREVERAEAAEAEADSALGAAAPNYGQLVQGAVTAEQVFATLRPDEALVAIVLDADHGWTLALRDGRIALARVPGTDRVGALAAAIRTSVQAGPNGLPPPFAADAAAALYDATLAPIAGALAGAQRLVVAPSGPLLSIPFGLLLRAGAGPDLAQAPFLARSLDIAHVPAPANFVSLRRVAGGSQGRVPWVGVGDPVPVTLRQARASFPNAGCQGSAEALSRLPRLAGARSEIDLVRQALGGSSQNALLGAAFTRAALLRQPLSHTRVVHFATHGLLPTDLACQDEPALLASAPPGATDAAAALITASQIAQWQLDADVVILSACNTSGPDGRLAGESLSGLARSFFYAGARGLLVTHWPVNDRITTVLVAGTMQRLRAAPGEGLAAALAAQQRAMLAQAKGPLAGLAHPFYWASLALVGDGSGLSAGL